jgi:hypothetical protein
VISRPLIRFQLQGFFASSRALPPYVLALLALFVLHGTGSAPALDAYATSAVVLFPIYAWTARQLLETEPDEQRGLSTIAVGNRVQAQLSSVTAASIACLPIALAAMVAPWPLGAIEVPRGESTGGDILLGALLQLLAIPPAALIGAWASRPLVVDRGRSMLALVGSSIAAILIGLETWSSAAAAVAPPLASSVRAADRGPHHLLESLPMLVLRMVLWCLVVGAGWLAVRRRRT